jgi:hypothetical protein
VPSFRAAQISGARLAFFVSLVHVQDRLKQGDGVFESGLGNRYFGFVWGCLAFTIVVNTLSSRARTKDCETADTRESYRSIFDFFAPAKRAVLEIKDVNTIWFVKAKGRDSRKSQSLPNQGSGHRT